MILLFSDFGPEGPYVGQVKTVLAAAAPDASVIDIMHDAPAHDPRAGAYLLAALGRHAPAGAVWLAVVDPGVGGDRPPVVLEADGNWFVGPGNGLFEIVQRRAAEARSWTITWRPERMSPTFHGRDLFAPVAARIAMGEKPPGDPAPDDWREAAGRPGADWPDSLEEIIYIDRFGNLMAGITAVDISCDAMVVAGGRRLTRRKTFSDAPLGEVFWHENSNGLVEISGNRVSAADALGLRIGDSVSIAYA